MAPITYSSRPGLPTPGLLDGLIGAPAGVAAQYPRLFTDPNGGPAAGNATKAPYPVRPAWHVAGVDYPVGVPATIAGNYGNPNSIGTVINVGVVTNGTTTSGNVLHFASTAGMLVGMGLTDNSTPAAIPTATFIQSLTPTTVTMTKNVTATVNNGDGIVFSGLAIDTVGKTANFVGNDLVVDGYDFSGWQLFFQQSNRPILQNCNCSPTVIQFQGTGNVSTYGNDLTVRYCNIDCQPNTITEALKMQRGGSATVEYCWLKNAKNNTLSNGMPNLVFKYNLIELSGTSTTPADHSDLMQTYPQGVGDAIFTAGNSNIAYSDGAGNAPSAAFQLGNTTRFFGTPPPEFTASTSTGSTDYFIVAIGSTTFQVSATRGGSPITPSTNVNGTGTGNVAWSPQFTTIDFSFNTWIETNKFGTNLGTIGIICNGNTHQNQDTAGAGYPFWLGTCNIGNNVFLGGASLVTGGGIGFWLGFTLAQTAGPCSIHDNYVDVTGFTNTYPNNFVQASTTLGSQPFNGPIMEANNILLTDGSTIPSTF